MKTYDKMKKGIFGAVALLTLPWAYTAAQTPNDKGGLNRQMEVTRAYEPTVDQATKLSIKPDMVDTMTLRPEVNYRISPTPVNYGFDVEPIRAANINTSLYRDLTPGYLKAGLGIPFQSVLDFYYSSGAKPRGSFGVYANHYGSWSKIKNDFGIKTPASETFNKIGAFGEHRFRRMAISGEIGYNYDMVSRYGYYSYLPGPVGIDTTAAGLRLHYSTIHEKVTFGHSFEDLSYFNFRLGLAAAHFSDRFDNTETDVKVNADLGKQFGAHAFTFGIRYEGYWYGYINHIVTFSPLYRLMGDSRFDFALGFDYTASGWDMRHIDGDSGDNDKAYFYPRMEMSVNIGSGYFRPYVKIDGALHSNSRRNTIAQNPYAIEGPWMPNTSQHNGRVGFTGSFTSAFSYNVFGGLTYYKDMNVFINYFNYQPGNTFWHFTTDAHYWTAGAEIEGRVSGAFGIDAAIQYFGYTMDGLDKPANLPDLTAHLRLKYTCRDKLILTAGVNLTGRRYFYEYPQPGDLRPKPGNQFYTINPVNAVADVYFGAEYSLSRRSSVFLNGSNLLNQKLYPFNRYPGLGVNAIAGVKFQF